MLGYYLVTSLQTTDCWCWKKSSHYIFEAFNQNDCIMRVSKKLQILLIYHVTCTIFCAGNLVTWSVPQFLLIENGFKVSLHFSWYKARRDVEIFRIDHYGHISWYTSFSNDNCHKTDLDLMSFFKTIWHIQKNILEHSNITWYIFQQWKQIKL